MRTATDTEQCESPANRAGLDVSLNKPTSSYSVSAGFEDILIRLKVSVAFTSYQSGVLYGIGARQSGGLQLHRAHLPKPMGLACNGCGEVFVSSGAQIIRYRNVLCQNERANGVFDACFAPRILYQTGMLDMHDIGVDTDGMPVFVNTRYNCLSALDTAHSFRPVWLPEFIDGLFDEDRCHLNGLAMDNGQPAFVTAVSRSNAIDGWRDRREDGGIVIDVAENRTICTGLSMPHSPRKHDGELWVLNSGRGEIGRLVRPKAESGTDRVFEPLAFCPGLPRGLAFMGKYAFVGLSKPRYKRFEGLALDRILCERDCDPWCGIQIIDTQNGNCVEWLRIDGEVEELYDVALLLPSISTPMFVAYGTAESANLVTLPEQYRNRGGIPKPGS